MGTAGHAPARVASRRLRCSKLLSSACARHGGANYAVTPPAQPMSGSSPSWVTIPNRSAVPQISTILPSTTRKMPIASQTARQPAGAGS
jgi:hypothetical protein